MVPPFIRPFNGCLVLSGPIAGCWLLLLSAPAGHVAACKPAQRDALDGVLRIFEKAGYQFVTLHQAQSDEAYKTPETHFTPYGWMWGYRWAKTLNVKVDGSKEPEVPQWIEGYR